MNIYTCWYRGNLGYGCRRHGQKWMFVPELGQSDKNIYRDLSLEDLIFKNPEDKYFELKVENEAGTQSILEFLQNLFSTRTRPQTVAGELLSRY